MILNFPLHAFNSLQKLKLNHRGNEDYYIVSAHTPYSHAPFNSEVLGFRLVSESLKLTEPNSFGLGRLFLATLGAMMTSGSKGQIYTEEIATRVINLSVGDISTIDFASPAIERQMGNETRADYKDGFIDRAFAATNNRIQ